MTDAEKKWEEFVMDELGSHPSRPEVGACLTILEAYQRSLRKVVEEEIAVTEEQQADPGISDSLWLDNESRLRALRRFLQLIDTVTPE